MIQKRVEGLVFDPSRIGLYLLINSSEHLLDYDLAHAQRPLLILGLEHLEYDATDEHIAHHGDHEPDAGDHKRDELAA